MTKISTKPKEKEKENIIKDKNDFNKINEIEKLNSIEINTLEMKKNIIKQDDESMEQITNKNEIIKSEKQFSEKAKKNNDDDEFEFAEENNNKQVMNNNNNIQVPQNIPQQQPQQNNTRKTKSRAKKIKYVFIRG